MEHQYWKEKVAGRLRDVGYAVQEEYPIGNGKTADLLARKNGKKIAIEIETGKSDAVANIRKCLGAGFDRVLCLATSVQVKEVIEKQVQGLGTRRHAVGVHTTQEACDMRHCQEW